MNKIVSRLFAYLPIVLLIPNTVQAKSQSAVVCVLPISATAVIDEMSGAPRVMVGQPLPRYQVQIDQQTKRPVDHQVGTPFVVPRSGRHLIKIFADDQLAHSFHFHFSGADVLYLGMSEVGYQTWAWTSAPSNKRACM